MAGDTRDRMLAAAVEGLQQHGVAGMSFTDVLTSSGAARGAIYHHFPGGKTQLVNEAARQNGEQICHGLSSLTGDTPIALGAAFLDAVRPVVAASAAGGGCAVAAITVMLDGDSNLLRQTADSAFASWIDGLAARFVETGLGLDEATDLSATLIALLEGAHVLCRAAGDVAAFDRTARAVLDLLQARYGAKAADVPRNSLRHS